MTTKHSSIFWDNLITVIVGVITAILLIGSMFVQQGQYLFGSFVVFILFWSAIEIITPAAKGVWNLVIRVFIALPIGIVLGGLLTYYTQFGDYVITPALNGNIIAIFALVGTLALVLQNLHTALYAHSRQFIKRRR